MGIYLPHGQSINNIGRIQRNCRATTAGNSYSTCAGREIGERHRRNPQHEPAADFEALASAERGWPCGDARIGSTTTLPPSGGRTKTGTRLGEVVRTILERTVGQVGDLLEGTPRERGWREVTGTELNSTGRPYIYQLSEYTK